MNNLINFDQFGKIIKKGTDPVLKIIIAIAALIGIFILYKWITNRLNPSKEGKPPAIEKILVGIEISPKITDKELDVVISAEENTTFMLIISDDFGQKVLEKPITAHKFKLDVSHFSDGKFTLTIIKQETKEAAASVIFEKKSKP